VFVVGETEDRYKRVQAYVRNTPKNLIDIRKHFDRCMLPEEASDSKY